MKRAMYESLNHKNVLVTGAGTGIGRAIAQRLADEGANVLIVGRTEKTLAETAAHSGKISYLIADLESEEGIQSIVRAIAERYGHLDILVNNAGITRDKLVLNMDEKDFDAVIGVNLKGTFNMIKHTYKHFMKKRYGRIVSTSSVVGIMGNAGQANYSASKAGIIGMTKSVAKELAGRGVTVNAVAPGYIGTDMTNALSDKVKDAMKAQIPAKRIGTPEDVANVVAFLCSDDAAYVTGEVIKVDGGLAM